MAARWCVPGIGLVALLACGEGPSPDVLSSREGPTNETLELREELRIGGLEGSEEDTFGSISTLAPAPDGSVYVADGQVPIIRRYDSEGRYIRDVGQLGQGPGEYRSIHGIGVRDDGQLTVWDPSNRRLNFFDTAGSYIESASVPSGFGRWRGSVFSGEGDAFIQVFPESGFVETPDGVPSDWARVTPTGGVERLHTIPMREQVGPTYMFGGRGGMYAAFVTATLSALGPDGSLYHARNDEYRITRVHPGGRESEITRDDEPRLQLGPEERTQWEVWSEYFARNSSTGRSNFFPIPKVKPYIRELVVDPEGRLWVSRHAEASFVEYSQEEIASRAERGVPLFQWRDALRWDVFDSNDEFLGFVIFPDNTSFVTAVGDAVWGIQSGKFREDYVVRWRMLRSGGEP